MQRPYRASMSIYTYISYPAQFRNANREVLTSYLNAHKPGTQN